MSLKWIAIILLNLFVIPCLGNEFEDWILRESKFSIEKIESHISPPDGATGSIIASSSRSNPNYYFHWIRDSAITMEEVARLYLESKNFSEKNKYRKMLFDYIYFERKLQREPTLTGLGEPKFNIDGTPFNESWGRPQNDGPALRAVVMIHIAHIFLNEAQSSGSIESVNWIKQILYDNRLPTESVIKMDLEYISHHWSDPCFDIWEEHFGHHFVTQYAQKVALENGAKFALRMGDFGASQWYREQAKLIEKQLSAYWNPNIGAFSRSLEQPNVIDSSFVLAVVHMKLHNDLFLKINDEQTISTILKLEDAFKNLYFINRTSESSLGIMSPAIGRYEEDNYQGGNPWVLLTLAFSEYYFQLAKDSLDQETIQITPMMYNLLNQLNDDFKYNLENLIIGNRYQKGTPEFKNIISVLIKKGDSFLVRIHYHTGEDLQLSEQIDKNSGNMISASDLTWNYTRFLFCLKIRTSVKKRFEQLIIQ